MMEATTGSTETNLIGIAGTNENNVKMPEPPLLEDSVEPTRASVDGDDLDDDNNYQEDANHTNVNTHHQQHHSTEKGIFPLWTRLTDKLHQGITKFVVTLSVNAAMRPYTVIASVLFLSFALVGIGFFTNFNINVEETEIYSPFNSIPQEHFHWRNEESGFVESTRVTTFVVHANGENVLGYEPMERVFKALDTVRSIPGYEEICEDGDYFDERTEEWTCRIISATRFWYHDTEVFYSTSKDDADVIQTLSQTEYPGGIPADHEYVLGKLEREPTDSGSNNGTITYVPAYFVYVLLSNKEQTEEFEIEVIERLSALQKSWEKEEGNILQLEYFAERSFSDEFTRAIEEDMYLVPVAFLMMAGFTCIVFFSSDRVKSRSGLGVGSVTTIGMSLMSGFGILFICGVPFTSMTQILPFVVFGVGLDDTFIITGAYLRTDVNLDPVERVRLTMQEVGASITTTTVTTIAAFILGLSSSVPAIYWLCLYAFPTIFIDYIYQITFFVCIMVLDERRIQANREDICICLERPDIDLDNHQVGKQRAARGGTPTRTGEPPAAQQNKDEQVQEKQLADRVMAWYAKQLMRPVMKAIVVVIFTYFFALCIYRTTLLTQEFDVTELFPEGSYCTDVLDAIQVYQERSLQVEIYFRDIDQSDPQIQEQMLDFVNEVAALPPFEQQPPLCWVRDFQQLQQTEYFDGAEALTFEQQVQYALSIPAIKEAYGLDIVHEDGNITASRCIIVMKNEFLDAVNDQISVLIDTRAVADAQPINNDGREREAFFTFNQVYLLWEFYNVAISELITTTISSVVAVSVVALVFVPHWSAIFFIVPMVSIVYIDLLGTMQVAGLHVNAVTYVCLVISIGLIVDFLMHILLRYHESQYKTREGRVKDTLETMGSSILLGGLSTFLGVIPLAFSTSTILRTVFTSLLSMVILGVTHGLVLLPVVLSVIGPQTDIREDSGKKMKGSNEDGSLNPHIKNSTFESLSSSDAGSPAKSALSYHA